MKSGAALHRFRARVLQLLAEFKEHFPKQKPKEPLEVAPPIPELVNAFSKVSKWASIFAIVVGYHVFVGWVFNIRILQTPYYTFSSMKVNEAICSVLLGTALLLLVKDRRLLCRARAIAWACSGAVVILGLLTLSQYVLNANLGLDQFFLKLPHEYELTSPWPGRMAIASAIAFSMVGLSLLVLDVPKGLRASEVLALISGSMALLAIASYLYAAKSFNGQMSFYTALVILLLSLGIMAARSDRDLLAKVTSNSFGGVMARRLLPPTLLIPILLGWLLHQAQKAGWYGPEAGLALFAVGNVLLFLTVLWWGVNSLHRMDTKRRRTVSELEETAAKLARSNADLEQFAYVASHDLKEPLRAISGSVQILQDRHKERIDPATEEVIKHTVDGANRMQTLIDDLLTYSRLTTREAPLAPTDTSEVLQEVQSNLEAAIKESKAVITHDRLPTVKADRIQLLQVFQNLISNAIKYRSQRTPKIHIGAEARKHEVVFSVRDNGIGIAPQYADRIFRIFQRLHTRSEYAGTGIGLAVCKKVVERHGGRMWVESELEEGSTFFFTLPISHLVA